MDVTSTFPGFSPSTSPPISTLGLADVKLQIFAIYIHAFFSSFAQKIDHRFSNIFMHAFFSPKLIQKICSRFVIRPRCLVDVSKRDVRTTLLGSIASPARLSFPIGIAPTGAHCIAHSDGEIATAKGNSLLS